MLLLARDTFITSGGRVLILCQCDCIFLLLWCLLDPDHFKVRIKHLLVRIVYNSLISLGRRRHDLTLKLPDGVDQSRVVDRYFIFGVVFVRGGIKCVYLRGFLYVGSLGLHIGMTLFVLHKQGRIYGLLHRLLIFLLVALPRRSAFHDQNRTLFRDSLNDPLRRL